ncbi:MAG: hypothetical protein AUK37_03350 [Rhodobacterales bacterium CG2_30_65_12]|nr:MAG: hypothetical protein AUK37_03350 [Rhodobacterales bacterium CG2_30_65_12]
MAKTKQRPPAEVAKCDEDAPLTAEQKPLPEAIGDMPYEDKSPAEWAYERLILYIQNFEDQLDNEHEVAMGFAGGEVGILRIEGIGYFDPDLVTFYGTDDEGTKTQLIQHVSQLNVMLRAEPREDTAEPPNRIGFRLAADLGKHGSGDMGKNEG